MSFTVVALSANKDANPTQSLGWYLQTTIFILIYVGSCLPIRATARAESAPLMGSFSDELNTQGGQLA